MKIWVEPRIQESYKGQLDSLGSKARITAILTEGAERFSDFIEREFTRLAKLRDRRIARKPKRKR